MSKSKLKQIEIALLKAIPDGESIELGEDTFLTGMLDGSDKIYGFSNEGGKILVDGGGSSEWPISSMDKADVDYLFSELLKNIKTGKYTPMIECDECGEDFPKSEIKTVMIPGIGKTLNETKVCPHCETPIIL